MAATHRSSCLWLLVAVVAGGSFLAVLHRAVGLELGMNIDPTNPDGDPKPSLLTLGSGVGAGWVRIEYKDSAGVGSPPTPSTLSFYKAKSGAMQGAGIQVLMILDYSSLPGRPAASGSSAQWQTYTSAFAKRCGAVVAAMGSSVAAYEIWNEPDLTHVGNVPAQRFGPLLHAAYDAVKGANPRATVVMGGLASGNPGYVVQTRDASGGHLYADAVGVHPYGQRPSPDWPNPTWGFGILTALLQRYYQVLDTGGATATSLWITEVGTNVGGAIEAVFPQHVFAAVAANATVSCDHVFWFCWSDGMVNGFGVTTATGAHKPSYASYQQFARSQH